MVKMSLNGYGSVELSKQQRALAAGVLGGSMASLILHPLELLKTRQAVHCNLGSTESRARYSSLLRATCAIWRSEGGTRGLFRGVSANVAHSALSWGLYFTAYGAIRRQMVPREEPLSIGQQLLAASAAGSFTVAVTNPLSVLRTRLILETSSKSPQCASSAGRAIKHILATEGVRALYKGLAPSLLGVSHGAIQFLAYEEIKKIRKDSKKKLTTWETLLACSASKVLAALMTYPCQNLRACKQAKNTSDRVITVGSILRRQGPRGLYKGLLPYLMHVVPNVCLVFLVYEALV